MGFNIKSILTAAVLAIGLLGMTTEAKADPAKPYRFDIRTIATEMCNEFLAISSSSIDDVEGCRATYDRCVTTLADLGVATAEYKKFYREEAYVYATSVPEYFVFVEEFRKSHLSIRMVRFDDHSGLEIPMMTSFELTWSGLKTDVGSVCKLTPIFPLDLCGNGVRDSGESCDDGIDNGKPGKCPDSCKFEIKTRNVFQVDLPFRTFDFLIPKK